MTITNGYCTLQEAREALLDARSYSAATISFTASTKTIADTAGGLARFMPGMVITVTGSVANNKAFTVVTNSATALTVSETVTDGAATPTVTITDTSHTESDSEIEQVVEAVSRMIDNYTRRRFWTNTNDETRYFTAGRHCECQIYDCTTVTTLKTDDDGDGTHETTWTTGDWIGWPLNYSLDGWPMMEIHTKPNGDYSFPLTEAAVQIVGKFGFSTTTPAAIKRACIIQVLRIFKRRDAPFGVTGAAEFGNVMQIASFDPDVKMLLAPYRRYA